MKNKTSRILLVISALALLTTFFFPLWDIAIFAPQYPEGLYLKIWLNKISGDLNNINILNHYVGMKVIAPTDIPELVFFPKLVMGLLVTGIFCIIVPRIWAVLIHLLGFSAFSLFALYDFWKWEFEYGHNLSPDAPIKVPGMTYQPPLFGTETLLNITIYSYPAFGGWMMMISFGLVVATLLLLIKKYRGGSV